MLLIARAGLRRRLQCGLTPRHRLPGAPETDVHTFDRKAVFAHLRLLAHPEQRICGQSHLRTCGFTTMRTYGDAQIHTPVHATTQKPLTAIFDNRKLAS